MSQDALHRAIWRGEDIEPLLRGLSKTDSAASAEHGNGGKHSQAQHAAQAKVVRAPD
jgi:hypothetical protein